MECLAQRSFRRTSSDYVYKKAAQCAVYYPKLTNCSNIYFISFSIFQAIQEVEVDMMIVVDMVVAVDMTMADTSQKCRKKLITKLWGKCDT